MNNSVQENLGQLNSVTDGALTVKEFTKSYIPDRFIQSCKAMNYNMSEMTKEQIRDLFAGYFVGISKYMYQKMQEGDFRPLLVKHGTDCILSVHFGKRYRFRQNYELMKELRTEWNRYVYRDNNSGIVEEYPMDLSRNNVGNSNGEVEVDAGNMEDDAPVKDMDPCVVFNINPAVQPQFEEKYELLEPSNRAMLEAVNKACAFRTGINIVTGYFMKDLLVCAIRAVVLALELEYKDRKTIVIPIENVVEFAVTSSADMTKANTVLMYMRALEECDFDPVKPIIFTANNADPTDKGY